MENETDGDDKQQKKLLERMGTRPLDPEKVSTLHNKKHREGIMLTKVYKVRVSTMAKGRIVAGVLHLKPFLL